MMPKVLFKYSWIYDQNWRKWIVVYGRKSENYPSTKSVLEYIKKVEKIWRKHEKPILKELSAISGLGWKSKSISCYVVGRCEPFSDPLTLPVWEKYPDYFIDVLTHELIHQLFTQEGNMEKAVKAWNYIHDKYKKLPHNARIHIPLHAIHSHVYMKFFNQRRLDRDVHQISFLSDYKKSWETVKKEGYENIIREFTKRIKKSG